MGYYHGDYYAGDPGFFSVLGKIGKGILGAATGLSFGGTSKAAAAAAPSVGAGLAKKVGTAIIKHPVLSAAGGAAATAATIGSVASMHKMGTPAAAGMAAGMHKMAGAHALGFGRRHRRMRVTNVRALRRAIRRANGFARLAKRVLHFTSPRAPKGRAVFKMHRKKKRI